MKNDEKLLKDRVNKNDNTKEKIEKKKNKNINEKGASGIFTPLDVPIVSVFENHYSKEPLYEVRLDKFLHTTKFKTQVEEYRASTDDEFRRKIKGSLRCVTPSGTFSQRQESSIIKHTELICVDIDAKDNPMFDLAKAKHMIGECCPSLYYAGLSLSGEGIFLIFRISNPEFHKQHFEALAEFLSRKFELQVDRSVKSPVSLRVVSYDLTPYYNPNPVPFPYTMETDVKSGHVIRTVTQKENILKRVKKAVSIIQAERIDITNQYQNWFKIGCALAYEFGEDGRYWFHMISRVYKDYNEGGCDIQYNRCLKYKKDDGAKIGTFFYLCKRYGVNYE